MGCWGGVWGLGMLGFRISGSWALGCWGLAKSGNFYLGLYWVGPREMLNIPGGPT